MLKFQPKRILGLLLVAALLCGAIGAMGAVSKVQAQAALSKLRFVHASVGAPNVDIYVDNALAAANVAFGDATRFLNVSVGDHSFVLTQPGSKDQLFSGSVTVTAELGYTVAVEGKEKFESAIPYEDELTSVKPGYVRFRAINAVIGGPALDILQVDGKNTLPLAQGVALDQTYGSVDIPVNAGKLVVVPSGSTSLDSAIGQIDAPALVAGTYNVLAALGSVTGPVMPFAALYSAPVSADDPSTATLVRLVHASVDAPAVDIYVNDTLIAPNLTFGVSTPHVALAAGNAKVAVRLAKADPKGAPVFEGNVTLTAGGAATVIVAGPVDGLTVTATPDNIEALDSNKVRLNLINATGGSGISVALKGGPADILIDKSNADVDAGIYDATVATTTPELKFATPLTLSGGVLYDVIVAGDATSSRLIIAPTGLTEKPGSAPTPTVPQVAVVVETATDTPAPVVIAQAPTETPAPPPTEAPAVAPTEVPVVIPPTATLAPPPPPPPTPTEEPTTSPDLAPAATDTPEVVAQQPTPELPGSTGTTGTVNTDPGVNLKIREYPFTDAKTLGLVPSGTVLIINGVKGPDTNDRTPTPVATATLDPKGVIIEDVWIFVTWVLEDNSSTITGWTKPQYLDLRDRRGHRISKIEDVLALPLVPGNQFGKITEGAVTPVPPDVNFIIGTVIVDAGVSLQLRRTPDIQGESLNRLASGTEVQVIEKTEVKSKGGLIGEPESLVWLRVRFVTDSGSITGWVNSQYMTLRFKGRPIKLEDVPTATEITVGGIEGNPAVNTPPPPPGVIATVDGVNPGTNLQFRRTPDASAESLGLIPYGAQLPVKGRNGTGTWLLVDFNGTEGWVNVLYVTVTKNGKKVDLFEDVKNVTEDVDATVTPTLTPTVTPGG